MVAERANLRVRVSYLLCRLIGHRWKGIPPRYFGMWCCDEVCKRCGYRSWWPQ